MPAYDESKRAKAFGVYTGCPCTIQLKKSIFTTDKNLPKAEFNRMVDDLIDQWKSACDKFCPGPRVGSRITQNWDRNIKLLYGKSAHINCVFHESNVSFGGSHSCKFSLKEEISLDKDGDWDKNDGKEY